MRNLSSRQRAILRSLAHSLKPVVQIGKDGVDESVLSAVSESLNTRELLKVRVLETAPRSADEIGAELARRIGGAHLVHVIGRTLVLYRRHPTHPLVTLPEA